MKEELERRHDVIEAPLEAAQHIPNHVQSVEDRSRPKRSPKPKKKYSPEIYDLSYDGRSIRNLLGKVNKFTLG